MAEYSVAGESLTVPIPVISNDHPNTLPGTYEQTTCLHGSFSFSPSNPQTDLYTSQKKRKIIPEAITDEERTKKRQKRLLQNRLSAAASRQRKKDYIVELENDKIELQDKLNEAETKIEQLEALVALLHNGGKECNTLNDNT